MILLILFYQIDQKLVQYLQWLCRAVWWVRLLLLRLLVGWLLLWTLLLIYAMVLFDVLIVIIVLLFLIYQGACLGWVFLCWQLDCVKHWGWAVRLCRAISLLFWGTVAAGVVFTVWGLSLRVGALTPAIVRSLGVVVTLMFILFVLFCPVSTLSLIFLLIVPHPLPHNPAHFLKRLDNLILNTLDKFLTILLNLLHLLLPFIQFHKTDPSFLDQLFQLIHFLGIDLWEKVGQLQAVKSQWFMCWGLWSFGWLDCQAELRDDGQVLLGVFDIVSMWGFECLLMIVWRWRVGDCELRYRVCRARVERVRDGCWLVSVVGFVQGLLLFSVISIVFFTIVTPPAIIPTNLITPSIIFPKILHRHFLTTQSSHIHHITSLIFIKTILPHAYILNLRIFVQLVPFRRRRPLSHRWWRLLKEPWLLVFVVNMSLVAMFLITGSGGKDWITLPDHGLPAGFDGLQLLFIHWLERCDILLEQFPG